MAQAIVALLTLTATLTGGAVQTGGTPRAQADLTGGAVQTVGTPRAQADLTPVKAQTAAFTPASGTTSAMSAALTGKAAAPNLRACYDGKCKLTLSKAVAFRVSPRFGVTRLSISFGSGFVRVKATGSGVTSQAQLGAGGSGSVNGIGVRVVSASKSKAVLSLSPTR
jgi:hypothetical protein